MLDGTPVRLAGEDCRRGTFSQRHAMLVDYETGTPWTPMLDLPGVKAKFWVYDSLLSEYAALGYEYGYSVVNKDALVLWEAQFGDFINGAQIIIDQYIVGGGGQVGPDVRASSCSCRTATRARVPSTRAPASNGSSRCAPRTTSRSPTPRRRRSTSTSCGAR